MERLRKTISILALVVIVCFVGIFVGWIIGKMEKEVVTETTTIHHTVTVTPMQTTALMEGDWNALKMFEGKGSRITESFYVPTSEWRIKWEYKGMPQFEKLNMTYFSFGVVRKETGDIVFLFVAPQGSNSDITYIYEGKREYYIQVGVANLEYWKLTIEIRTKKEELKTTVETTSIQKVWTVVKTFEGKESKTTESFYISTDEWRIKWEFKGDEFAYFSFSVHEKENDYLIEMIQGEGEEGNDITYIHGDGRFYIKINAANLNYWKLTIEEIGEIKSEDLKTMEKTTTAFITETQTITETQKITHSKRWVQFGSFSSDYGTTISQVYEIPTYWWRVIWSYDSYEYGPYFEIKIFNNKTKEQLGPGHALGSPSFSSDKVGHVEGTFYFQGEGAYYFEVVAKNIKYWIIKIEILI